MMKIVQKKIDDLIQAEYNPRQLSEEQEKSLTDSLTRFGVVDPILVNINSERHNIIIGGHQRCMIWKKMGNTTIDTIEIDLTYDKERELNVRLNKNTGEFDWGLLDDYFDTVELVEWGFDENELIDKKIDNAEDGEVIELPKSLQVKPSKEYILIMADANSLDWEDLKEMLKLKMVRRGGYKKKSAWDSIGLERVIEWRDLKERLDVDSSPK